MFGGDGYVCGIDGAAGFMVCTYLPTRQAVYIKDAQLFVCQLCCNTVFLLKMKDGR